MMFFRFKVKVDRLGKFLLTLGGRNWRGREGGVFSEFVVVLKEIFDLCCLG